MGSCAVGVLDELESTRMFAHFGIVYAGRTTRTFCCKGHPRISWAACSTSSLGCELGVVCRAPRSPRMVKTHSLQFRPQVPTATEVMVDVEGVQRWVCKVAA